MQGKGRGAAKRTSRKQLCHCFLIIPDAVVLYLCQIKNSLENILDNFCREEGVELKLRLKLNFSSLPKIIIFRKIKLI